MQEKQNQAKQLQAKIFQELENYQYPAKSGLNYNNEFTFIVAVLLSAQAKDAFINTQTIEFFKLYNTPEKMLEAGINIVEQYIRKIGLWRNKAKNIIKLSEIIINFKTIQNPQNWYENFQGEGDDLTLYGPILSKEGLPGFRSGLLELAGIGRKSANVFLNVIYNAPVFPVDTHVMRIAQRIKLSSSKTPFQIEKDLIENVPKKYSTKICHYLVWHGRKICLARKPKCLECSLKKYCAFFNKELEF